MTFFLKILTWNLTGFFFCLLFSPKFSFFRLSIQNIFWKYDFFSESRLFLFRNPAVGLKSLYKCVHSRLSGSAGGSDGGEEWGPPVLLVDDISMLLSLGVSVGAVLDFSHYCRAAICSQLQVRLWHHFDRNVFLGVFTSCSVLIANCICRVTWWCWHVVMGKKRMMKGLMKVQRDFWRVWPTSAAFRFMYRVSPPASAGTYMDRCVCLSSTLHYSAWYITATFDTLQQHLTHYSNFWQLISWKNKAFESLWHLTKKVLQNTRFHNAMTFSHLFSGAGALAAATRW